MLKRKLSPSGLATYLKSPKAFYWRYVAKLESVSPSVATYDHDKIAGILWSSFVERFYNGTGEDENTRRTLAAWDEQTSGWVPEKAKERLTKALTSWAASYYQMFSKDDGCRTQSEVFLENDRFLGYLDGLNDDRVIHEVKSTSRSPQLSGQLWRVQNSIQVKCYVVLAEATGVCIEYAFKDSPHALYRSAVLDVTPAQRRGWEQELNTLADHIQSLGTDINNYVCNSDACNLCTKGVTSMCQYMSLCDGVPDAAIMFKPREYRK